MHFFYNASIYTVNVTINTITNKILIASNNMKIITIINTTDGNFIL